jgi:ketopantoate reductase
MKMRILIYGAGVIGCIFAGKLAASGKDITVLARGKHLEDLRQNGIVLSMPGRNKKEIIPVFKKLYHRADPFSDESNFEVRIPKAGLDGGYTRK